MKDHFESSICPRHLTTPYEHTDSVHTHSLAYVEKPVLLEIDLPSQSLVDHSISTCQSYHPDCTNEVDDTTSSTFYCAALLLHEVTDLHE